MLSPMSASEAPHTPPSSQPTQAKRWQIAYTSDPLVVQTTAAEGHDYYDVPPDQHDRLEVSLASDQSDRNQRRFLELGVTTTFSRPSSPSRSPSLPINIPCESIPSRLEDDAMFERLSQASAERGSWFYPRHLGGALSVRDDREPDMAPGDRLDEARRPEQPQWRRIFSFLRSEENSVGERTSEDSLNGEPRDRKSKNPGIWNRLLKRKKSLHGSRTINSV